MARNVCEKRKRIAHNKTLFNENHEMYPEDCDMLSSIMKEMDNLPSISTNIFEANLVETSKMACQKKAQSTVLIPSVSHTPVPKSKIFGPSRKHPLMEKSQKFLKQLKHNRKIPKPRAHLSGLSNSVSHNDSSPPAEKSKKTKFIEKKFEKYQSKVPDKCVPKATTSNGTKIKNSLDEPKNKNTSKKHELSKSNYVEESSDVEMNSHEKKDHSSESDDEYETFVQKQKKGLKLKSKSQKKCIRNQKSQSFTKINKKRASKNMSSESDSDSSEKLTKSYRNRKRIKSNHKVPANKGSGAFIENSDSEIDTSRDEKINKKRASKNISSGSDSNSGEKATKPYKNRKRIKINQKVPANKESTAIMENSDSEIDINNDENFRDSESDTADESNPCGSPFSEQTFNNHHSVPEFNSPSHNPSDTVPLIDNNLNVLHKTSDTTPLIDNNQSSINNLRQEDSDKSLIIDLTDSDNECDTFMPKIVTVTSQNENKSSDESEIELVNVIVYKEKTNGIDELNIKPEKVDQTPSCSSTEPQNSLKSNTESKIPLNRKHEAVYATGVCQQPDKETESKENILKKTTLDNDTAQSSIPSSSQKVAVLNKVKKEMDDDDCKIVLDIASTSNSTKILSNVQICNNTNIKTEKDPGIGSVAHVASDDEKDIKLTQKEQKLHEVACSNLSLSNEGTNEPTPDDIKTTLKLLKKEIKIYEEIVEAEASVENSFKILERRQAFKLISLKSQLAKLVESSSIENRNLIKNAVENTVKDCIKVPSISTSAITTEDLKTFASVNLVPLSSIPESDIKPNLSELQSALKQEPGSSDEINNMSFGEKCIVCAKNASAACQQCAKVFFCSDECGKKYWEDGHKNTCAK